MMMKQNEINLSLTLTENRVPANVRGSEAYRLIFWVTDAETGEQRIHDINEYGAKRAIKDFNRLRAVWASEGLRVTIEAKI